jgi:predicted nucleotidyltransferase
MRSFRDRDFIKTNEDFFFCVVGSIHPPSRVISYIKYAPSKSGNWGSKENRYNRMLKKYTIPNLLKTYSFLRKNYPQYFFYSSINELGMSAVPKSMIKKHYKPEERLTKIIQTSKQDTLQKKTVRLTKLLSELSNISLDNFGITGSLLLDIHHPDFSDIDLTIYGKTNSWILKTTLDKNVLKSPIKKFSNKYLEEWCKKKIKNYPLTLKEANLIYQRKWNLGIFEGTRFSIHPIKIEKEINVKYGQKFYKPLGKITVKAVVSENIDSIFLPAVYEINDMEVISGPKIDLITEVVSYETLYGSLAKKGEKIEVNGKLERVIDIGGNEENYRIIVGSIEGKGNEYFKLVKCKS